MLLECEKNHWELLQAMLCLVIVVNQILKVQKYRDLLNDCCLYGCTKVFVSSLPLMKQKLIILNEKPIITPDKVLLLIKKHMKIMFLRSIYL